MATYSYNGFRIDEANAQLIDPCGKSKRLRNKAYLVLLVLANSKTRLVTREEIIRQVWPATVVSDDSLVQCIREIRVALGVSTSEVLITRPRIGYELHPDTEPPNSRIPAADVSVAREHPHSRSELAGQLMSDCNDRKGLVPESNVKVSGDRLSPSRVKQVVQQCEPRGDSMAEHYRSQELVGRQAELNNISQWLMAGACSSGQNLLLITGDAGVGKSSLINDILSRDTTAKLRQVCSSLCFEFGVDLAYCTLANWLRTPDIYKAIALLPKRKQAVIRTILPELSGEVCEPDAPDERHGLESYNRILLYESVLAVFQLSVRPLLFVIDNLQWCDRESLAWLEFLKCRENSLQYSIVCISRPCQESSNALKFVEYFRKDREYREIRLQSLKPHHSEQLLKRLLPSDTGFDYIHEAVRVANGLPLYLCEIARCSKSEMGDKISLDAGIRHFIEFRLGHLHKHQVALLETCAVLGTSFSVGILASIVGQSEEQVLEKLDSLWELAFLDILDTGLYTIHDVVRSYICDRLPPVRRTRKHLQITSYYQLQILCGKAEAWGPLAWHYQCAGMFDRAADCYLKTAELFRYRSAASAEAEVLQQAIKCLNKLPHCTEVNKSKVEVLLDLGLAWSRTSGWGADCIGKAWREAWELSKEQDDVELQLRASNTFDTFLRDNGNWHKCAAVGAEAFNRKACVADPYLRQSIVSSRAAFLLHTGDSAGALSLYNDILLETKTDIPVASYNWFNSSHRIGALFRSAQCLWLSGRKPEGVKRCAQAIELSEKSAQPFHQAITLFHVCLFYEFDRDFQAVISYAVKLLNLATEYSFSYYIGAAQLYIAYANLNIGKQCTDTDKEANTVQKIIESQYHNGTRMFDTYWFANLAMAHLQVGKAQEAYSIAYKALERSRITCNSFWNSELHRICGDAQRVSGKCVGVDSSSHYHQSIEIAKQQGAVSLLDRAQKQTRIQVICQ